MDALPAHLLGAARIPSLLEGLGLSGLVSVLVLDMPLTRRQVLAVVYRPDDLRPRYYSRILDALEEALRDGAEVAVIYSYAQWSTDSPRPLGVLCSVR